VDNAKASRQYPLEEGSTPSFCPHCQMEAVKGFNDYTGQDALKRRKIAQIVEETFKNYGFQPAETPIIESEEFVRGENAGDEAVSDVYRLEDKGKRKLALRYEFTFQLKRIAQNKKLPYKRYQIGPVFRDEPVSGNRSRQFTQCDIDVIGSTIKEEAEVLAATSALLKNLNINFTIFFNNRKLLNEILESEGITANQKEIIREIDKLDKLPEKEVKENLKKLGAEKILEIFKKPESSFKKYKSYSEIEQLKQYCEMYGVDATFLPSLARGLSYYNGSVFEVKTAEMKETICGGGSFITNNLQSTGISQSIERLSMLAKVDVESTKILVISIGQDKEAIKLAQFLRSKNVSASVSSAKISKAMEYASSYNIEYVAFMGEEEVKSKKIKFKNLISGKELSLEANELLFELKPELKSNKMLNTKSK
jgi:histidyl-tRNA synthetase